MLTWIFLDATLPEVDNDAVNVLRTLAGIGLATAAAYVALAVIQWRPRLHLQVESLLDAHSQVGRPIDAEPFTPPLIRGSAWFLVYAAYDCTGPVASFIGAALALPGHTVELKFEPAEGLMVNIEQVNGARVTPLAQGRRGVAIALPSPLPKGRFAVFQLEYRPVVQPAPLPVTATASLVRAQVKGRRRLRWVRMISDLKTIRV